MTPLLGSTAWISLTVVFVGVTLLLGGVLIHHDAFDLLYELSREHEDWQLDEVILTLFAALLAFSISALVTVVIVGRRLLLLTQQQLETERHLAHSRKMQAMGNLLGGVAHSINNHLVPIQTLSKLVKAELPESSEEARDLERVIQAAQGASGMLRKVLNFVRQDEEMDEACAIAPTLAEAMELLATILPGKVRLETDIAPLAGHVAIAKTDLEVILLNMVGNSVDAMEDGPGEVHVTLSACGVPEGREGNSVGWVCVTIRDTGKGMDKQTHARMFDPFFTTKPVGKGTGLGMSETYGIVSKAGGVIDVSSTPGQGTAVHVRIPLLHKPNSATA